MPLAPDKCILLTNEGPPIEIKPNRPGSADAAILADGFTSCHRNNDEYLIGVRGVLPPPRLEQPVQILEAVRQKVIDKCAPRKNQIVMIELVATVFALQSFAQHMLLHRVIFLKKTSVN